MPILTSYQYTLIFLLKLYSWNILRLEVRPVYYKVNTLVSSIAEDAEVGQSIYGSFLHKIK